MASVAAVDNARAAKDGDTVRVNYTGKKADGSVFDVSKSPLSFEIGGNHPGLFNGFSDALRGKCPGDEVTVTLPPEKAFGERKEEMVLKIPAGNAPQGLQVGQSVALQGASGQIQALVVSVTDDGVTVDANHPLAGETLSFDLTFVGYRKLLAPEKAPEGMELATFAAGCFWGVELAFQRVAGVISTNVGYAQGSQEKPTYEQICTGTTGHTEAVRVVYNPKEVSFESLLEVLWERVGKNATTLNLAGNDRGTQYRSGIYFHSKEQEEAAKASVAALEEKLGEKVVTEVEEAQPFWLAEDYHQQYLEKGGRNGQAQSAAKGCTDTIRCYG